MEFLYPSFDKNTHLIISSDGISVDYPSLVSYQNLKDYNFGEDKIQVALIRENIGYGCNWSYIKVIDQKYSSKEYFNKSFYVLNKNLENVGGKSSYEAVCSDFNTIDLTAERINPLFKETFIPYIDRYNGLFSVRVQIDYDRIVDMKLFNKVLQEVYLEGVNILLASRGFKSDNDTINNLKNKYYCFAYINNDLDVTVRRPCEPLTFTVSIPLNFFNKQQEKVISDSAQTIKKIPTNFINFTNNDFISTIDLFTSLFHNKSKEIEKAKYPNYEIENFMVSAEVNSLRAFAVAANEIMSYAESSITAGRETINYQIGLDNNLNIVTINIKKYNDLNTLIEEIDFAPAMLAQARLRGEFNNKRIFNYFLNQQSMISDYNILPIIEYITKYVKYADARLVELTLETPDGTFFTAEQVKEFRMNFQRDTESCIKVSDLGNLINAGTRAFEASTSLYHLFTVNDPNNSFTLSDLRTSVNSAWKYISDQRQDMKEITGSTVNIGTSNIFQDVAKEIQGYTKKDFQANLTTLGYVAKRLDMQEILFTRIFCYLKGSDPNARDTAKLLSEIPYEAINYLKYLRGIQNLKGAAYIRALEEGISFDMELFCSDQAAYFIKALTKILDVGANVINATISFTRELDASIKTLIAGRRVSHPYEAIVKSVSKTLYIALTNFLFEYIRDLLLDECDESILEDDFISFFDPFSTHYDINGTIIDVTNGKPSSNNNRDRIRNNRLNALNQTLPDIVRELTFGSDIEYTVDLIDLLLRDVNCILTATESLQLLQGRPSEEVTVLIKNIIRNKYGKDPNNLSYLLNDDKLKLFFQKLGLTVDQEYITKYLDPVLEYIKTKDADVCTPAQYETRSKILENKIPKELGVLAADTRNRVEKARKLLEKLKNGGVTPGTNVYTISALCPEVEDDEIKDLKYEIFEEYKSSIKSTFSPVLNSFTEEVNKVSNKFAEERQFVRRDGNTPDSKMFETVPYFTYNSNLYENMFYGYIEDKLRVNPTYLNKSVQISTGEDTLSLLYVPKDRKPISEQDLSDSLVKKYSAYISTLDECIDIKAKTSIKPQFEKMIKEGRILYENLPYGPGLRTIIDPFPDKVQASRDWESIEVSNKDRYLEGLPDGYSISNFHQELLNVNLADESGKTLLDYIKEKKYVIFINSEKEMNRVAFRLVYFDPYAGSIDVSTGTTSGDFKLLSRTYLIGDIDEKNLSEEQLNTIQDYNSSLSSYTGEVWARLDAAFPNDDYKKYYREQYPTIKIFYMPSAEKVALDYAVRVLDEDFLTISGRQTIGYDPNIPLKYHNVKAPETFNFTQENVLKILLEGAALESINTYEKYIRAFIELKQKGLFNITTDFKENKKFVNVSTTGPNDTLEPKNFYNYKFDIEEGIFDGIKNLYTKQNFEGYRKNVSEPIYQSIYSYVAQQLSSSYLKNQIDNSEYFLQEKEKSFSEAALDASIDFITLGLTADSPIFSKDYSLQKNINYNDIFRENYEKTNRLDYGNNIRFKNCNLFPHYLNIDYFLGVLTEDLVLKLCDTNLSDIPLEILDSVLVRLTIRTYITDQLIKVIPFLSLLSKDDLDNIHEDKFILDIMKYHMRSEMHMFTNNKEVGGEGDYYTIIEEKIKEIIEKDNQVKLIIKPKEGEDNIDVYIKKEIRHFIKFSLGNGVFTPRIKSIYEEYDEIIEKYLDVNLESMSRGGLGYDAAYSQDTRNELYSIFKNEDGTPTKFLKHETNTVLLYMLMSSTVDFEKRNILATTKAELARILFARINEYNPDQQTNAQKPEEDLIKFMLKLAYTGNPTALAILNPDYSRYIKFFIEASFEETRSILLNSAMFTDYNVTITKAINFALTLGSTITWGLLEPEKREDLIKEAALNNKLAALTYKRIDAGMSPTPDAITSIIPMSFGLYPGATGRWYYILDTIKETIWYLNANKEIDDLANKTREENSIDKCNVLPGDATTQQNIDCSTVKDDINKYEE